MRTASLDVRASASLLAFPRVGFVVPRYKHSAVLRNRLKRRLREIVRLDMLTMLESLPPCDVVLRAFPSAYARDFDALRADVRQAFSRLQRGGWPQPDAPTADSPGAPAPEDT